MITSFLSKIFGSSNDREIKRLQPLIEDINAREGRISALTDAELSLKTNEFKAQLAQGKHLDDILPEAFAVVREASKRILGQRHYDVQLMGGVVMHQGKIAEMKTGEGKTLTATLPLYLNALAGKGAFLVTVNDYLARRDSEWMRPLFEFLGMTIACLQNSMDDEARKVVYGSDIIYATNNELGFDYLRDNMKFRLEEYVQRDLSFAIVDEVDSILIDEARTPLIISGAADQSSNLYEKANQAILRLNPATDYEIDEKQRSALLTESGIDVVEDFFGIENMYAIEHLNVLHHISQALKAHAIFKRDVDYVVRDNQVLIVDEFTGRILAGRRYSDGLHQALEAKEHVRVERESQTLASITLQNFFRLFSKLAGMTGTALTEAEEFHNIYKLDVVSIPTNKPMIRKDKDDLIFLTEAGKFKAILADVKERYEKKQPVLIGTIAVETSERLSDLLRQEGIPHEVLNAKQHAREAEIVEHAGKPGHITIATNMAGRGTDIKLPKESLEAGGLYILGTERHESRRIDNQLRGRAGRQGDAGESRFYISLEDNLIRIFAGNTMRDTMRNYGGMTDDESIESSMVSGAIEGSQEKVEKHNFDIRKHLLEYDDVMNQHRKVIYQYRRQVLENSENTYELIRDMIITVIEDIFTLFAPDMRQLSNEQLDALYDALSKAILIDKKVLEAQPFTKSKTETLLKDIINYAIEQYTLVRKAYQGPMLQNAEKWLMLETVDQAWKQHMLNLDNLKEGINLRGWGQKNPLIEYKKEAFVMFKEMMQSIARDIVQHIFKLQPTTFDASEIERKRQAELEHISLLGAGQSIDMSNAAISRGPKVGRNDDCACGSGKKSKKCCAS